MDIRDGYVSVYRLLGCILGFSGDQCQFVLVYERGMVYFQEFCELVDSLLVV